ncbi:MAG: excisionase family DNA-binding protein [Kiritimatiellae bacterium]|nr:excisionase family DNA-binding protein [Kiritimatiellia bacterium]
MKHEKKIQAPPASDYLRGQKEAAQYARVSTRTISDWQARRVIPFLKPARKLVLFRKSDIDQALSKFEVTAI